MTARRLKFFRPRPRSAPRATGPDTSAPARWRFALLAALLLIAAAGCTPRVIVRAHPTAADRGIRYYRPKPYLKVEPAEVAIEKGQTTIVPGVVRVSLAYLPDFSEEYSIEVRSGLGIADVGIKLEDGWNLTEISQDLDSQTDENLRAVGEILSAVGDVVPTARESTSPREASFTVPARNVPIGYYESVIGRDGRGCKRLLGFRYVGFIPFAGNAVDCIGGPMGLGGDPLAGLYGLSFMDGQMVFLPLDQMGATPAMDARDGGDRVGTALHEDDRSGASRGAEGVVRPAPDVAPANWDALEAGLRAHLKQFFDGIGEVRARREGEGIAVTLAIPAGVPDQPIRDAASQWLREMLPDAAAFDVDVRVE